MKATFVIVVSFISFNLFAQTTPSTDISLLLKSQIIPQLKDYLGSSAPAGQCNDMLNQEDKKQLHYDLLLLGSSYALYSEIDLNKANKTDRYFALLMQKISPITYQVEIPRFNPKMNQSEVAAHAFLLRSEEVRLTDSQIKSLQSLELGNFTIDEYLDLARKDFLACSKNSDCLTKKDKTWKRWFTDSRFFLYDPVPTSTLSRLDGEPLNALSTFEEVKILENELAFQSPELTKKLFEIIHLASDMKFDLFKYLSEGKLPEGHSSKDQILYAPGKLAVGTMVKHAAQRVVALLTKRKCELLQANSKQLSVTEQIFNSLSSEGEEVSSPTFVSCSNEVCPPGYVRVTNGPKALGMKELPPSNEEFPSSNSFTPSEDIKGTDVQETFSLLTDSKLNSSSKGSIQAGSASSFAATKGLRLNEKAASSFKNQETEKLVMQRLNGTKAGSASQSRTDVSRSSSRTPRQSPNETIKRPERKPREGSSPERDIKSSHKIGLFFMPFWNLDISINGIPKTVNWFWGCLKDSWVTDCLFTQSPLWGEKGRDYSGETRPDMSQKQPLRGFYEPNDPKVIAEQIAEMKAHGIDYLIYDWFWGRHYYHDLSLYYPEAWKSGGMVNSVYGLRPDQRAGLSETNLKRIRVPGMELHSDQLHTIVETLEKLDPKDRISFALNWCDDSYDNWIHWLKAGQPGSGTLEKLPPWNIAANMPEEKHSRELFLRVHEKMVNLWVDKYMTRSFYLKDDSGMPIVYHMYNDNTVAWASTYGVTLKTLVELSNKVAREKGLPGIKFIAVIGENGSTDPQQIKNGYGVKTKWLPNNPDQSQWFQGGINTEFVSRLEQMKRLLSAGYGGINSYAYYSFTRSDNTYVYNTSFELMVQNYKNNWNYFRSQLGDSSKYEFHIPTAVGWDMSPAGGYTYDKSGKPSFPDLDIGLLPVDKYQKLLEAAKDVPNSKYITLCCWNEYMEGNIIEPTKGAGKSYLEAIKKTFMIRSSNTQRPGTNRPPSAGGQVPLPSAGDTKPKRRSTR